MRTIRVRSMVIALTVAAVLLGQEGRSSEQNANEGKLIALLKSEAPLKEKADACRVLAKIGTRKAVPALVALLDQEKEVTEADETNNVAVKYENTLDAPDLWPTELELPEVILENTSATMVRTLPEPTLEASFSP